MAGALGCARLRERHLQTLQQEAGRSYGNAGVEGDRIRVDSLLYHRPNPLPAKSHRLVTPFLVSTDNGVCGAICVPFSSLF